MRDVDRSSARAGRARRTSMGTDRLSASGRCAAFLAACSLAIAAGDRAEASAGDAAIGEVVRAYHEAGHFSGAVLVAEGGRVVYEAGIGLADRTWSVPNAPTTRFLIGSAGKVFTALLVMQLAEEGALDLDGVVTAYLPAYRRDTGSRISLRQLLTHTSGLPDYFSREFYEEHKHRHYPHDEFVERFVSQDLSFEPGTAAQYSSGNYYLLGLIVEQVTGQPFGDVLETRVFRPLGMWDSGFDRHLTVEPRLASGYIRSALGYATPPFEVSESSAFGGGAMYSSVRDVYRFDRALAAGELLDDAARMLVSPSHAPVARAPGNRFAYGATVGRRTLGEAGTSRLVHEMGGNTTTGFASVITRVPEDDHLVVLLANTGPGYFNRRLHDMRDAILSLLYGGTPELPEVGLAQRLGAVIARGGLEAALAAFGAVRETDPTDTHEHELNRLGYDLLAARRTREAIAVFEANVAAFPGSANVHDSLGEAHAQAGDLAAARASYERVVALDPEGRLGTHAREVLARLP